jgi:hypothetical protein
MDFITALPESDGYTQIWVIVDRLTKMTHFIPLRTGADGELPVRDLAIIFAKEIWRLHGLPSDIVSDRDTRFTSHFWQELTKHLGIKLSMSTAFHPQSVSENDENANPASELLIARWQGIWTHLQENIHNAQQRMARWYNAKAFRDEEPNEKEAYQRPLEERNEKEAYPMPLEERGKGKASRMHRARREG